MLYLFLSGNRYKDIVGGKFISFDFILVLILVFGFWFLVLILRMTDYLFYIVFFLCLFLYLHISVHYRKGEDLELFETDYVSPEALSESCQSLQPLLVLGVRGVGSLPNVQQLTDGNGSYEACLRDMRDFLPSSCSSSRDGGVGGIAGDDLVAGLKPVCLPMSGILNILSSNVEEGRYISEGNSEYLEEAGVYKKVRHWGEDRFAPSYNVWTKLDVWMGNKGAFTPLRVHRFYRQYLVPRGPGVLTVKMTPWKSRKYLHAVRDDMMLETLSPIVPWGVPREDQKDSRSRLKFLEFVVKEGNVLYIPPFWWYSVEFSGPNMAVYSYTYVSVMNWLANSDIWVRYLLASRSALPLGNIFSGNGFEVDVGGNVGDGVVGGDGVFGGVGVVGNVGDGGHEVIVNDIGGSGGGDNTGNQIDAIIQSMKSL